MTTSAVSSGWYRDPTGRHEYRYWDGIQWTEHVSDGGNASGDPLPTAPPRVVEPAPAPLLTVAPAAPVASAVAVLPHAATQSREVVATTRALTVGTAFTALGVVFYTIVALLSAVLGTQVRAGSVPSDFAFAIGTRGSPFVTAVYSAGILLPILGFAVMFLQPSPYRLSRAARRQWGDTSAWSQRTSQRNHRAYLIEHVGKSALYKRSVLGKLVALTVGVVAMLALAVLTATSATGQGFTLHFGAYALIGTAAVALVGVIVSWCAKRRTVHVDETGRLLDA
jgi:hypothetical protein